MAPPTASTTTDADTAPHAAAATFLVRGILVLGTRSLFIVRGTVASGVAKARQRVIGLPGMEGAVQSVEANLLDVNGGAAQSALTFHYARQAELTRWLSLVTEGTVLLLGDPGAP